MSSGKAFNYQKSFLQNYFEVFTPDLKGFGENADMPYPYSVDDYVQSVKEYAYKMGIVKPHVVAHSFGARLVLKIAGDSPDYFNKIVITGGAGLKPKQSIVRIVKRGVFNLLKPLLGREKLKSFYSPEYQALSPIMQQSFIKIVNEHLDEYAKKIENQTLLIYGDKDKQTPLYMAKRLNGYIKNSQLSVYKDAGHFAFIDCPIKFNVEVREFLLS